MACGPRLLVAVAMSAFCLHLGCGESGLGPPTSTESPARGPANAPMPGTSAVDLPHVVFSARSITIDHLGEAVRPPVTTASRPSASTMRSEDPSVVAVGPEGGLVALRNGKTRVSATQGSSSLEVEVRAVQEIRLLPARGRMRPGGSLALTVMDEGGLEVPPEAVTWSVSPQGILSIRRGVAFAGEGVGQVRVAALYGGARAETEVTVGLAREGRLAVAPANARLRRGQVRLFEARAAGLAAAGADWSSSDPRVLADMGGGMFQASARGRAEVCARAMGERACADVEVSP